MSRVQGPGRAAQAAGTGSQSAPILQLQDVSAHFDFRRGLLRPKTLGTVRAVDGVSVGVASGTTLGLVGESGSGKTTVGRLAVGMLKPTHGSVFVEGRDLWAMDRASLDAYRRSVQIVFQDPYASLDFRMKVGSIIAEPLTLGHPWRGRREDVKARVRELLDLVGLPADSISMYPHQFSGGQRQRIAIARALAPEPRFIVLDEPTSALDVSVRAQILTLLADLQSRLHLTYIVISHDLATVAHLASIVAVMYMGRLVEVGSPDAVYQSPKHPYTQLLISSIPSADTELSVQSVELEDEAPSPLAALIGCRYAPRCPLRQELGAPEICEEVDPALLETAPGHAAACHFAAGTGPGA